MKLERLGIFPNLKKKEIVELVNFVIDSIPEEIKLFALREAERFIANNRLKVTENFSNCNAVIALGGDGTLLSAARMVEKDQIPVLGIKLRSLGFLTEDDPKKAIKNLLSGNIAIQRRMRIRADLIRDKEVVESFTALNDIVIHATGVSRVLQLRTISEGFTFGEYLADGVIVSTPTGSTAYSLAAGGPIVNPITTSCMVITPLCPHSLSVRPLVVSSEEVFAVEVVEDGERSLITIDGQKGCPVTVGDIIEFKKSNLVTNLIVGDDYNFYELVMKKLRWGGIPRQR